MYFSMTSTQKIQQTHRDITDASGIRKLLLHTPIVVCCCLCLSVEKVEEIKTSYSCAALWVQRGRGPPACMQHLNIAWNCLACTPIDRYCMNTVCIEEDKIRGTVGASTWLSGQMPHLHAEAHVLQRNTLESSIFPELQTEVRGCFRLN